MKQRSKLAIGFTSVVLAGTLAFGAVASATGNGDGNGDGNGSGRRHLPHLTAAEKCDKSDEIQTRAAEIQQRLSERVTALQAKRSEAETAGDTAKVERIDRRLARLEKLSTRIDERLATFTTWVAENCDAA